MIDTDNLEEEPTDSTTDNAKNEVTEEINSSVDSQNLKQEVENGTPTEAFLSKRDLKHLRKQRQFEARKKVKRLKDKEKQKVKDKEYVIRTGQKIKEKRNFLSKALDRSVNIHVVFDLSFAHLMSSLDLSKLVKQISRCYSVNRSREQPLKLHLCSLSGAMLEAMNSKQPGFQNWQLASQNASDYDEAFKMQVITNN